MPRRSILSAAERDSLLALPDSQDDLIRHYTFNDHDLAMLRQRRGDVNRLGFAVQLSLLRYPGQGLGVDGSVSEPVPQWIARQLRIDTACWTRNAERQETRREHLIELRTHRGLAPFELGQFRRAVRTLTELAVSTDKGVVLAGHALNLLRRDHVIIPALDVIERICAEAVTRANRRIHGALAEPLSDAHRERLDALLKRKDGGKLTWLVWLRQAPAKPDSRHMLEHIERLKTLQALDLPPGTERLVHSEPPVEDRPRGRADDAGRPRQVRTEAALRDLGGARCRRHGNGHRRDHRPARPHSRQAVCSREASSDGQRFRAGGRAESTGHINPKYGAEPGRMFYTHISDQYAPFSTKVVNVGVRDSTYVLDGLPYHESDLRVEEHYTDTAGFTDHVFALMHPLGFRFAPRIRDLGDTKLYIPRGETAYATLRPMIGGTLNVKVIRAHWDEILRLATSIKLGTVTASLMLRKLGSYRRQNGLAIALRELGRIERTLFILDWLQSVELRRRVHAGLNKGEARNALARAVFFYRLGEIRDRSFEQQRYRTSGLNLVTAAIVLWNTVYLERAATALGGNGEPQDESLHSFLSPLGWEHLNLTGDYLWRQSAKVGAGKFRPLRSVAEP